MENINEVLSQTKERFEVDDKNLEMIILKNKLKLPTNEPFPDGLSGFINAYKDAGGFDNLSEAVEESRAFISAIEKAKEGKFTELSAKELISLGLVPESRVNEFTAELGSLKNIERNKDNTNNIWFQKGLSNFSDENVSENVSALIKDFQERKEALLEKQEYEASIIDQYNARLDLLKSFNLPDGYTVESTIEVLKSAKKEADSMLQSRKVA